MKKNIMLTSAILSLATTSLLFTGCNKPTERPSVVNSTISASLYAMKDLNEITAANDKSPKTVYFSGEEKPEVSKLDGSLKQVKIDDKVQNLFNLVSGQATKKMLVEHLKTGVIAIVVLDDQVKILKVVPETSSSFELTLTSLSYLSKLKALVKTSDAKAQASLVSQLEDIKDKSPAQLGEKFGLAEISAIIVKSHGHLDNERTPGYKEKKSILNVIESPFELSTHIIVGTEVGNEAAAKEAAAKEAAEKASAKK